MKKRKKLTEKEQGTLIGKFPCTINDDCGSTDAMAVYSHDDDSHSAYCWSCETSAVNFDYDNMEASSGGGSKKKREYVIMGLPELEDVRDDYITVDNPDRRLRTDIYEKYGCKMELQGDGETIDKIFYPTYRESKHVGYRIRSRFEEGDPDLEKKPELLGVLKNFKGTIGDTKKGIELFGQWLFDSDSQKRLFITEGEEDAMTGYAMTDKKTKFDGGYPHVSVPSGANVIGLKAQLEYINKYDEVYLVFDQDEAGQALLEKAVKFLPIGKVRIVKLPKGYKDLSALYTHMRPNKAIEVYWKAIWNAEKYSPAGIYSMSEGWSSYLNRGKDVLIPFPDSFGELNERMHGGFALGEITTIAAPSSVGKSSFVKEMIYETLVSTNYNVGILSLEETLDEFIEGMLSVHMSTQLNEIPYDERDRGAEYKAFQELLRLGTPEDGEESDERVSRDRIHFLDHQGACDGEALLDKVDFLVNGLDCKVIVLDPVTLALSGGDTDEDEFASDIVKRTKRHKLAWVNVHHVRKNAGSQKANSEGGDLAEEDMKGSGAWFQTSMNNILLTRNKVHDNELVRNTTTIKLSKCRRHGKNTGIAGWVFYNGDTGRLQLGEDPQKYMEDESGFEGDEDKPLNSFGSDEPWD